MKKILVLLIAVFMFASLSYANDFNSEVSIAWKSLMFENTTGDFVKHSVPTTTIYPGMSILGVVVLEIDSTKGTDMTGLYDGAANATAGTAANEVFDEAESGTATPPWYPYPRKILTQLNVHVGPNTKVIVYWE